MNTAHLPFTKTDAYLDLARRGKNEWWRYLLAVLLILFCWQILGSGPTLILFAWVLFSGKTHTMMDAVNLSGVDPTLKFVALMLASVFFLLGIVLAMRFIHRRSWLSLITPSGSISWGSLFLGFGLWFGLAGLSSILEAVMHPGRYSWTFDPPRFFLFMLLALLFIPIQASTEELLFRGYLLQGVGLRMRRVWLLCLISGLLFMAPHFLNPEAAVNFALMGLGYFAMGAFLAYMTLRAGRLELALGVHTANNLFSVLIANTRVSSLPSPSLFTVNVLDPVFSVLASLVSIGLFLWLCFGLFRKKQDSLPGQPAVKPSGGEPR